MKSYHKQQNLKISSEILKEVFNIMKIAVCEDSAKDRDKLLKQLQAVMKHLEVDADVTVFESAEELLKEAADKTFFSMFFLDILLPGISGMEAALKIRRLGNYSPVVFTTVTKDYLTQSYGVCASDYLVKPIADKDMESAFSRAIKMLEGEERTLEITVARHTEYIPYSDIYYIKGNSRNCTIQTRTGIYDPYASIQDLLKRLNDSRFLCSHRSYIINLDHVLAIQRGKVAMRDDTLLPVRRGGTEEVRRAWEDRRFESVSKGR